MFQFEDTLLLQFDFNAELFFSITNAREREREREKELETESQNVRE